MKQRAAEQVARIIYKVFQHEEQVDPRTVALVFQYIGRLSEDEDAEEREDVE